MTGWIEEQANALLAEDLRGVRRMPYERARAAATTHRHDYLNAYVDDLGAVVDLEVDRAARDLRSASIRSAAPASPTGTPSPSATGSTLDGRERRGRSHLPLHDAWTGTARSAWIRSSPYAMARLIALKDRFDVAFACDTDPTATASSRRSAGLLQPESLPGGRDRLPLRQSPRLAREGGRRQDGGVEQHDRPRGREARPPLVEVPVGFKWFVDGLLDGAFGFGGEESAGASFLRRDGTVWTTDKDGIIPGLLAAEITARTGRDPGESYWRR